MQIKCIISARITQDVEKKKSSPDQPVQLFRCDAADEARLRRLLKHLQQTAENAMGKRAVYSEKVCPSCVYMMPEFAGVGLNEEQLKAKNIHYK